jgi:putative transposase
VHVRFGGRASETGDDNVARRRCSTLPYIPMRRGFLYLVAVMDWWTRKVLSWRVSNTMDVGFCIEALEDALAGYGRQEIFNTDQGSQFTSIDFIEVLKAAEIAISMDGKGAWRDNIFVERLWRTIKYEEVYLRAYASVSEARNSISRYLAFYNGRRPHSSLGGQTPDQAYLTPLQPIPAAA